MKKIVVIALLLFGFGWANEPIDELLSQQTQRIKNSQIFKGNTTGIINAKFINDLAYMVASLLYLDENDNYRSISGKMWLSNNEVIRTIEEQKDILRKNIKCP